MTRFLPILGAAALAIAAVDGASAESAPSAVQPDVSADIARGINAYRASLGLPAVPISAPLTAVARAHAGDLASNHPDRGVDPRGLPCNTHSWSATGSWSAVCYTADHHYASSMWSKPREITRGGYASEGYEIAMSSSGPFDAATAVAGWRASPAHNDVIAEQGIFSGVHWQAMGVGVAEGYAVVWFGKVADTQR